MKGEKKDIHTKVRAVMEVALEGSYFLLFSKLPRLLFY